MLARSQDFSPDFRDYRRVAASRRVVHTYKLFIMSAIDKLMLNQKSDLCLNYGSSYLLASQ